jgi:hypothetical protein
MELWGLYEVVGQQFEAPPLGSTGLETTFRTSGEVSWIRFVEQGTPVDELDVVVTEKQLAENYPSPILEPQLLSGPTGLSMGELTAPQYTFERVLDWQASTPPSLPIALAGATGGGETGGIESAPVSPSIWMYPDSLLATQGVGSIDVGQAHVLLARDLGVGQDAAQVPLQAYAWATLVTLQVQRPPGADIGVYLISGIDAAARDRLQAVARHLQRAGTSDAASLSLLFAPNATSSNPRGLASQTLDPSKTFLLKANLSTVTTSGGVAPALALQAGMSSQPYSSPLSSAAEFLTFVWEASVTGTGGFYLNYNPVQSKAGLPDHLFADSDETSLRLLILLDAQSRELDPDRTIYAFNNCAVLAENVDPAAVELVAELSQPRAAQLIRLATLSRALALKASPTSSSREIEP